MHVSDIRDFVTQFACAKKSVISQSSIPRPLKPHFRGQSFPPTISDPLKRWCMGARPANPSNIEGPAFKVGYAAEIVVKFVRHKKGSDSLFNSTGHDLEAHRFLCLFFVSLAMKDFG